MYTITILMSIKKIIAFMLIMMLFLIINMKYLNSLTYMMMFILYTTMLIFNNYLNFNLSMYMYMIFISFISSMMIMFLYFTSIINNQKSKLLMNKYLNIYYPPLLLLLFNYMPNENLNMNFSIFKNSIHKIYLYPLNFLSVMMMIYMLYILIMIMKMCSMKYIPLRKMK